MVGNAGFELNAFYLECTLQLKSLPDNIIDIGRQLGAHTQYIAMPLKQFTMPNTVKMSTFGKSE